MAASINCSRESILPSPSDSHIVFTCLADLQVVRVLSDDAVRVAFLHIVPLRNPAPGEQGFQTTTQEFHQSLLDNNQTLQLTSFKICMQ